MKTSNDVPATGTNMAEWVRLTHNEETFLTTLSQYQLARLKSFVADKVRSERNEVRRVIQQQTNNRTKLALKMQYREAELNGYGHMSYDLDMYLDVQKKIERHLNSKKLNRENASRGGSTSKNKPDSKTIEALRILYQQRNHPSQHQLFIAAQASGLVYSSGRSKGDPIKLSFLKKHWKTIIK